MIIFGLRILFFQVYRIQIERREIGNKLLNYFAKFAIFTGLGFALAAPIGPVIKDPVFMKLITPLPYFMLFVATAYLTRLSFAFLAPKLEKRAFWSVMFLNFLFVFFMIKDFILSPSSSQYFFVKDIKTGLSTMEYPSSTRVLDIIICVVALIIPGILFIIKGLRGGDSKVMLKALLLGVGLVFFGIGGATNSLSHPSIYIVISGISLTLGFLFLLWGVFYNVEKDKALAP